MLSPYRTCLLALCVAGLSAADFLAEPYVQLGRNPVPSKQERLSIVWHAPLAPAEWALEYQSPSGAFTRAKLLANPIRVRDTEPFQVIEAQLENLKPGARFAYRVLKNNQQVFASTAQARKKPNAETRFVVWGDCAQGTKEQKQVADEAGKHNPDFVFIAGDIVYSRGRISEYRKNYFPYYKDHLHKTLFLGVPGNHDSSSQPHLENNPDAFAYYYFWKQPIGGPPTAPAPEMKSSVPGDTEAILKAAADAWPRAGYYSFDYGPTHWTVLDSNAYADWNDPALRNWLEDDLKANANKPWRIVAFHHPGFNASKAHFADQRMRVISDILERHKVSLVFAGHVHNYQRSHPLSFKTTSPPKGKKTEVSGEYTFDRGFDGAARTRAQHPIYIVTGAGGARLYDPDQTNEQQGWQPFTKQFVADVHSFTLVDATKKSLTVREIGANGKEVDRFVVTR